MRNVVTAEYVTIDGIMQGWTIPHLDELAEYRRDQFGLSVLQLDEDGRIVTDFLLDES
jgi:hypothetical protein